MSEPYKGLRPYEEADRDNFFGREADKFILIDKILANKLTLLFAASGVGKSSLLQAAVLPELKHPERKNLEAFYYKDWVATPSQDLKNGLIAYFYQQHHLGSLNNQWSLKELLQQGAVFTREPLVIVLDQFEEFFNYHRHREEASRFLQQLAAAINDRRTATAFVIAMREDFAVEMLEAVKPYLPTLLLQNFYRLTKLTREQAQQAILAPVKRLGFEYEAELVEMLLQDLGQREPVERPEDFGREERWSIESPDLQIVCSQLWELDRHRKVITRATYESQGRATGLLNNYFHERIAKFSSSEKNLASKSFDYLVNRYGTKEARALGDLAKLLRVAEAKLSKTLDKLEQDRVLRKQARQQVLWYELYHDTFSKIIYAWNEAYKARRRRLITFFAVVGVIVLSVGYDFLTNRYAHHFRLSLKATISDEIELYQGPARSWDLFKQQHYLYETGYARTDLEPDKLFERRPVAEFEQFENELIASLPFQKRMDAYWEVGNSDKVFELAKMDFSHDQALTLQLFTDLASYRSKRAFKQLIEIFKKQPDLIKTQFEKTLTSIYRPLSLQRALLEDADLRSRVSIRRSIATQMAILQSVPWLKNSQVEQILQKFLDDPDSQVQVTAAEVLGESGEAKVIKKLIDLLQDSYEEVRRRAARVLGELQAKEAAPDLIKLLKDLDGDVRFSAAYALGQLGATRAIPSLVELLKDPDTDVRKCAAYALGQLGATQAIPSLVELLKNPAADVRFSAAYALGQLGATQAIPSLVELLKDPAADVRKRAAEALGQLGATQVIPSFVELLKKDPEANVRFRAADALGKLGATQAIPSLVELLKDSMAVVRSSAAKALGRLGATQAIPFLVELLKNPEADVRSRAAEALGKVGATQAIPSLVELLKDPVADVRSRAAEALGRLGDARAISALIKMEEKNKVTRLLKQFKETTHPSIKLLANLESETCEATAKILGNTSLASLLRKLPEVSLERDEEWDEAWWNEEKIKETLNGQEEAVMEQLPLLLEVLEPQFKLDLLQALEQALEQVMAPRLIEPLKKIATASQEDFRLRLLALRALGKQGEVSTILEVAEKQHDMTFTAIQAFSRLPKVAAESQKLVLQFLQNQLAELDKNKRAWREQIQQEQVPQEDQKSKKTPWPYPHWETELGYAIAQVDTQAGMALLSHNLANVREGAWLGLGHRADVDLVQRLYEKRKNSSNPLFRQAAYRALDIGLVTLEVRGSKEDLGKLRAWKKKIEDDAVQERVEWTILELEGRYE